MKKSTLTQLLRSLAAASLLGLLASPAWSAEELVMSSWLPSTHPIVTGVMQPWALSVADATDGRVTVRILEKPIGPPSAHYDLAADGLADVTYGLHSFTRGDRFLRSRLGQFSFLGDTAEETSVAYWNVYSGDLNAQQEHEGTKLLGLFVHGPGMFHSNNKRIESVSDFVGLRIRTPGGYITNLSLDLDATAQFMGSGQVVEKLSTGVIDGVTFPMQALKAFKLTDHLTHSMRVPGGMYNTSWFLVVNEERWAELSATDRSAIESVSGEALAILAGQVWDAADQVGLAWAEDSAIEIYDAPESLVSDLRVLAAQQEREWARAVATTGYDGIAALATLRSATSQQ